MTIWINPSFRLYFPATKEAQHSPENLRLWKNSWFDSARLWARFTGCYQQRVLAAHEAKSVARFHLLHDELATIQKNLDFLTTQQQPNIQAIVEFEKKYRQQVSARHEKLPSHFDWKYQLIGFTSVPHFITTSKSRNEQPETLQINQFLQSSTVCVWESWWWKINFHP